MVLRGGGAAVQAALPPHPARTYSIFRKLTHHRSGLHYYNERRRDPQRSDHQVCQYAPQPWRSQPAQHLASRSHTAPDGPPPLLRTAGSVLLALLAFNMLRSLVLMWIDSQPRSRRPAGATATTTIATSPPSPPLSPSDGSSPQQPQPPSSSPPSVAGAGAQRTRYQRARRSSSKGGGDLGRVIFCAIFEQPDKSLSMSASGAPGAEEPSRTRAGAGGRSSGSTETGGTEQKTAATQQLADQQSKLGVSSLPNGMPAEAANVATATEAEADGATSASLATGAMDAIGSSIGSMGNSSITNSTESTAAVGGMQEGPVAGTGTGIHRQGTAIDRLDWHRSFWEPLLRKYEGGPADAEPVTGLLVVYGNVVLHILEGDNNQLFALMRELRPKDAASHGMREMRVPCFIIDVRERLFSGWHVAAADRSRVRRRGKSERLFTKQQLGGGISEAVEPEEAGPERELMARIQQLELFAKFVGPKLSATVAQESVSQALSNLPDFETTTPAEAVVAALVEDQLAPALPDFIDTFDSDYRRYLQLLVAADEAAAAAAAEGGGGDEARMGTAAEYEMQRLAHYYGEHVRRDLQDALSAPEEMTEGASVEQVVARLGAGLRLRVR